MNRAPLSPTSALVAHAETLLSGARVLVVGNAENCLAEHLLERGARLVQVMDPDPRRVAHAAAHNGERRVTFAQLNETSFRDSTFDCAIVEDLAEASQPKELLHGLRRAVGNQGVALVACSSDDAPSGLLGTRKGQLRFAAFSEAVHSTFERVLLVAQTPFVGYAVVHLDLEAPPEPALDNGFLTGGADSADFYIAVAGRHEVIGGLGFEDMTIVQLPAAQALNDGRQSQRAFEQRTSRRIELLENELREARAHRGSEEIERLTAELEKRDVWIRQLEARAESADARADDAEAELERLEEELKEVSAADPALITQLRERVDDAERVAERCQKESKWADERVQKLEKELEHLLGEMERGNAAELRELQKAVAKERLESEKIAGELASARAAATLSEKRAADRERELRELGQHLADAEDRLTEAETKLVSAEGRLAQSEKARSSFELALVAANERRQATEKAAQALEQTVRDLEQRVQEFDQAAAAPSAPDPNPDLEIEVQALETQLAERGRAIAALEKDLDGLQSYAKTLVAEIALLQAAATNTDAAELERQLDSLARTLAEREADLLTASWTIGSLKSRLGMTGASA